MLDYEKLIKRLEDENTRVDVTDAQKEVNKHRIKWIRMVNRPKPPVTPYIRFNLVEEKLKNPDFQWSPNSLMGK
ncbi:hypothetical protein [Priestia megaterium]|uniref:hypothetical protein n=1 Tax=Priestia megaterium TaxID=1404 RepID=UPI002FFF65B6